MTTFDQMLQATLCDWEAAVGSVHSVPADVDLFATFSITRVEEADLRLLAWIQLLVKGGGGGVVIMMEHKCLLPDA